MSDEMIMQIVNWVIAIIPSLTAITTAVGVIYKVIKQFAELKKEVVDMKDIEEVKGQMNIILNENAKLKKSINELLTKIDHVDRSKQ